MRHFPKEKIQKFQVFLPNKMFWAFWALDIAPTLDVLVLFQSTGCDPKSFTKVAFSPSIWRASKPVKDLSFETVYLYLIFEDVSDQRVSLFEILEICLITECSSVFVVVFSREKVFLSPEGLLFECFWRGDLPNYFLKPQLSIFPFEFSAGTDFSFWPACFKLFIQEKLCFWF